ncbi:DUF397 domain-containing protein [Nocardiopsis sp. EMB25]|uniref:DUF397 domain-containing protein n=1 Tax=Nocardiopsis TaxID=2013 RepID=UPI000347964C|nr:MULTISPECIES: DUF397 domain-containing protein [Nocardiopsis]MCY9787026.1 DUF397 domain-containing protein [Nocardiopsis sp. EMB25]
MRGLGQEPGTWRVSSFSQNGGSTCVEVTLWDTGHVGVRDSTHRDLAALAFPPEQWAVLARLAHGV